MTDCSEIYASIARLEAKIDAISKVDEQSIIQKAIAGAEKLLKPEIVVFGTVATAALGKADIATDLAGAARGFADDALKGLRGLGSQVGSLGAQVGGLGKQVGSLGGQVGGILGKLSGLAGIVTGVVAAVAVLQVLGSRIDAVESAADSVAADLSKLYGIVGGVKNIAETGVEKADSAIDQINKTNRVLAVTTAKALEGLEKAAEGLLKSNKNERSIIRVEAVAKEALDKATRALALIASLQLVVSNVDRTAREGVDKATKALREVAVASGAIAALQAVVSGIEATAREAIDKATKALGAIASIRADFSNLKKDFDNYIKAMEILLKPFLTLVLDSINVIQRETAYDNNRQDIAIRENRAALDRAIGAANNAERVASQAAANANDARRIASQAGASADNVNNRINSLNKTINQQAATTPAALAPAINQAIAQNPNLQNLLNNNQSMPAATQQQIQNLQNSINQQFKGVQSTIQQQLGAPAKQIESTANNIQQQFKDVRNDIQQQFATPVQQLQSSVNTIPRQLQDVQNNIQKQIAAPAQQIQDTANTLEKTIKNSNLTNVGTGLAAATTILNQVAKQTSSNAIVNAVTTGVCSTARPGGCLGKPLNNLQNGQNNILNKLNLGLQAGQGALLNAMNNTLNVVNTKLGSQVVGGLSGSIGRLSKFLGIDRVLNLLNFLATLHNASMLTSSLKTTLLEMLSSVGNATGLLQTSDGDNVELNKLFNDGVEQFVISLIGIDAWASMKLTWRKYSPIYRAGANVLSSVGNMFSSIGNGIEVIGERSGKIGNALRAAGVVRENAYNYMSENMTVHTNKFMTFQTKIGGATEFIEAINEVAESVIEGQEGYTEAVKATDAFKKTLAESNKDSEKKDTDNAAIKKEVEAIKANLAKDPTGEDEEGLLSFLTDL